MVYYICSPKYQPMIAKIMTETDQVCAGNTVGEDIYLKKFVKENIMSFEQIDIFLIDFSALADTDEEAMEAVESLRIMDYPLRFIVLAPYKTEGDPFLKKCFYAGIYDIIISDEYLEISELLTHCITEGMRYKDALKYRDAVQEPEAKKEKTGVRKILIGICGAGARMGSTHNSIVLANMLRANNQMTALLEMGKHEAFKTISEAHTAKLFEEGYFSIQGVDFYPSCDREKVTAVSGKLYNFILLDMGSYEDMDKVAFNRCDVRMIFCGSKPWEFAPLQKVFEEQEEEVLKKYHFCFPGTTSNRLQKEILEHMEPLANIWFPEYSEDPFSCTWFPEGAEMLKEYLPAASVAQPKGGKKPFSFFKGKK